MFKLLLETLFAPNRALRQVAEERPVLLAAVLALLGAWGWAFGTRLAFSAGFLTPADLVRQFFPMTQSLCQTAYQGHWLSLLLLFFPVALLTWFFRSAALHLLAELLGGSGKGFSVLATVGFADLPLVLLLPTAWLCRYMAGSPPSLGAVTLWYVLAALLHLWSWTLTVLGIRLTHRLPTGTAAAVYVLVGVAFLGVSLLLTFAGPPVSVTR
ncbi:MAG: YIP1 family protein [Abditibacteriales bacterium]|nr:YIP1 family protein [Abditibacteriales bacterium]